jgi:hypothetical protein
LLWVGFRFRRKTVGAKAALRTLMKLKPSVN